VQTARYVVRESSVEAIVFLALQYVYEVHFRIVTALPLSPACRQAGTAEYISQKELTPCEITECDESIAKKAEKSTQECSAAGAAEQW
jgi:hypothetical protein